MNNAGKILGGNFFYLTENGGGSMYIVTNYIADGDPVSENRGYYVNQRLVLSSYGNDASINLFSDSVTPEKLRALADELEQTERRIIVENSNI